MNRRLILCLAIISVAGFFSCGSEPASESAVSTIEETAVLDEIEKLKLEELLRDSLELHEGVEVIVSYLEVPKNTTLPTHYHPGEEFVHILTGSGELTLEGQEPKVISAGETIKVPLKRHHSFSTLDESATAIVFRVHENGQPERIMVE